MGGSMCARFRVVAFVAALWYSSVPALAQGGRKPTVIVGTLLGANAKPLKVAQVWLRPASWPRDLSLLAESTVDPDGRFALATTATGPLLLIATGVDHLRAYVPLVIDRPTTIALDIRLARYTYTDSLNRVVAIGDWNKFDFDSGRPLVKQPDGRYTLDVETTEDTLAYQLAGLTTDQRFLRSINGTDGIRYLCDGEDYKTVIAAERGHATIVLDPKLLDRRPGEFQLTFREGRSREARIFELYRATEQWIEAYHDTAFAHKSKASVHFDWAPAEQDLTTRLSRERDPLVRELVSVSLLRVGLLGAKLDSAMARRILRDLPPRSVWWSFYPSDLSPAMGLAFQRAADPAAKAADLATDTARIREVEGYFERVAAEHGDSMVRARALAATVLLARAAKDEQRANQLFVRLVAEYPNAPIVRSLKAQFSPTRVLRPGSPVPEFRFVALGDSSVSYTRESLKGQIYLLDFWATWCEPCRSEMPTLHKAYEQFRSKGLAILSVSLDGQPDDVTKFRAGNWKMPWLHTFVSGGFHNPVMKQFEIVFIPRSALVGRDGTIIAVDEEVRGERLAATLAKTLP